MMMWVRLLYKTGKHTTKANEQFEPKKNIWDSRISMVGPMTFQQCNVKSPKTNFKTIYSEQIYEDFYRDGQINLQI
jgi:hypothetical protein